MHIKQNIGNKALWEREKTLFFDFEDGTDWVLWESVPVGGEF